MRAWILGATVLSCLYLGCQSRAPREERVKDAVGLRTLVLQVEGMVKVQGLT